MPHIDIAEMTNGRRAPDPPMIRLVKNEEPYNGAPWESPVPFDDLASPDVAFPVDALPEPLHSFVETLSAAHQVDPALPAAFAMTALSGLLCGRIVTLHGAGGVQEAGLFTCLFARSGERKTAVAGDVLRPLLAAEREAINATAVARRRLRDDLVEAERRVRELRERKAPAEELDRAYQRVIEIERAVRDSKYIVTDSTMEALQSLMAANGGRALIAATEGDILNIIAGRYSDKAAYEVLLRAYSGEAISSLRKNRPPEIIDRPAAAIALAVQPSLICDIAAISGASERGLLSRFLFAIPQSRLGAMAYQGSPIDARAVAAYEHLVKRLANAPPPDPERRLAVRLSADAEAIARLWHDALQDAIASDIDHPLTPWRAKAVGHLVRIAAVLHACVSSDFPDHLISADAMERASAILRYFRAHTEALMPRLVGTVGVDEERARLLLSWIVEQQKESFTVREAHRRFQRHSLFRRSKDVTAAVALLEERSFVRQVIVPAAGKPSTLIEVNPVVFLGGGNGSRR
ncbi:YfjI family protein [Roseiflexus sp.]